MARSLSQQLLSQLWEAKRLCCYAIIQLIIALCTAPSSNTSGCCFAEQVTMAELRLRLLHVMALQTTLQSGEFRVFMPNHAPYKVQEAFTPAYLSYSCCVL
jgi:hypothetical protein